MLDGLCKRDSADSSPLVLNGTFDFDLPPVTDGHTVQGPRRERRIKRSIGWMRSCAIMKTFYSLWPHCCCADIVWVFIAAITISS